MLTRVERSLVLVALACLVLAAPVARAGASPSMTVGAAEDTVKSRSLAVSRAGFARGVSEGLQAIRITELWYPGQNTPDAAALAEYRTTARAAALSGVQLIVMVYPAFSRQVPLDVASRAQFASFLAHLARAMPGVSEFVIGNEPNKDFFWWQQFNPDGSAASPAAYEALLAASYDALKAVRSTITVVGGALAPRGNDNPRAASNVSISPGKFLLGMGTAYRASGRSRPIMDIVGLHPYGLTSKQSPAVPHLTSTAIGIADYDKLVSFLGDAFDGTAQPGSTLPIIYDEYGVQTMPPPSKARLYTNAASPVASDAVSERTQGEYYRTALELAFCQPTVVGLLFFHTVDETNLRGWQSGLFYPDGTPKSDFRYVRQAVLKARRGILARCPGLAVPVSLLGLRFPEARSLPAGNRDWTIVAGCAQDCAYVARLVKLPRDSVVLERRGVLVGGARHTIRLPSRRVHAGTYRLTLRLVTRLNPGKPTSVSSRLLEVRSHAPPIG